MNWRSRSEPARISMALRICSAPSRNASADAVYANECSRASALSKAGLTAAWHDVGNVTVPSFSGVGCEWCSSSAACRDPPNVIASTIATTRCITHIPPLPGLPIPRDCFGMVADAPWIATDLVAPPNDHFRPQFRPSGWLFVAAQRPTAAAPALVLHRTDHAHRHVLYSSSTVEAGLAGRLAFTRGVYSATNIPPRRSKTGGFK